MRIRNLKIKNFRGIETLDWDIPDSNIICLIGKGDSSKSTILTAIQYVFYPQWNLSLVDHDFYQCKTDHPIVIEATISNLTDEFYSINKYGLHLRGWDPNTRTIFDEPDDSLEKVLTVRLKIESDLEPSWSVINDRNPEGVEFKAAARTKVGVSVIGTYTERQLSWGSGTALARLTETQNINESLATATRTARRSLDKDRVNLVNFDNAAKQSERVAKTLGVPVSTGYQAHLDLGSINIKVGGLSLHDGDMPLRLLGLGSRRMLLCGIQKDNLESGHITLFDEVEFGLEPHRIARLIKHIKEDTTGQYFLTTHSPSVLRELTTEDLHIVHSKNNCVQIIATANKELQEHEVQGKIRSSAEAFLARKIVVCEGATEVGFLRGFDDYLVSKGKSPLSYYGVALLDASGGSKVSPLTNALYDLKYEISVLADADADDQFSQSNIADLSQKGIPVIVWNDKLCLEQRAIADLSWKNVLSSVKLAEDELSIPAIDQVKLLCTTITVSNDINEWVDSKELRTAIGKAAKNKSGWFKSITKGDLWFKAIASDFDDPAFQTTDLYLKLTELWSWIENEQ